ncbi:MAG: hypothetical protein ACOY0T_08245 [Myxococcota bacterium]
MKTRTTFNSIANLARYASTASLALALIPAVAAAADNTSSASVAALDTRWNDASVSGAPGAESNSQQPARTLAEGKYSGWSLNFTPVLLTPRDDERLGGGVDPELKYTLDRGAVRLSAGLRVGGYYAKNLFGITAMPTLRLVVPVGPVEPYVSFGMGYGWLPKIEDSGIATMSRLGIVFRFSESFGLGVEGTLQRIERSAFEFPSFGSAVSLNF